jgi:Zn ribbon nucleic-acid-binding protein
MVETTLDIGFYADDEARVIVDSNAPDHVQEPAELVTFGHYSARVVNQLGPDSAQPLIHSLKRLEEASIDDLMILAEGEGPSLDGKRIRVAGPELTSRADEAFIVLARFLDPRRGPRMSFTLKARGRRSDGYGSASVHVLLYALLKRRAGDQRYLERLADTAVSIAELAASGRITPDNEFDLALAAADVAWRGGPGVVGNAVTGIELRCPACGNDDLKPLLWPSERAEIRRCMRCGAGVWLRAEKSPRLIAADVWQAMVAIRNELARTRERATPAAQPEALEGLKQAFIANGWPFSEVVGAHVLVSDLSGPVGMWKFYAQVVEEQQLLLLYSICPLRVPEERRPEISHFLTRVNYGLSAATFELDFDDGEVRCKTVVNLEPGELDATALKRSVRANGLAMETYLPAIESVIAGTPALPALDRHTDV